MESQSSGLDSIKVFKYRWVILSIYCLESIINFMQILEFSIISNIIQKHYSQEEFLVDVTTLVFFVSYIALFLPIGFLIEKFNLKWSLTTASLLTLVGNLIKLLGSQPNNFWVILVAQTLCAIAQVYLLSIPTKVATTWFGPSEVSTACALAVLGMQLGTALGCVQSPYFVTKDENNDVMESHLRQMFLYQAIAAGVAFLIVLLCFKARPSLPPSQSQQVLLENDTLDSSFFKNMKLLIKNKNFWIITWSLGLATGLWNAFGILINSIYLNYFPNGESDAGLVALLAIISGGCIGSIVLGVILDKTHLFKFVGCATIACATVMFGLVIYTLEMKSRVGSFITIPIFGFFTAPVLVIGFEYLIEVTYPIPETCSSAIFNASYYLIAIVITLIFGQLIDSLGHLTTNIIALVVFALSSVVVLLVKSDLKRLNANKEHKKNSDDNVSFQNGKNSVSSSVAVDANSSNNSTRVTISKL